MIELYYLHPHISASFMMLCFLLIIVSLCSFSHKSVQKNVLVKIVLLVYSIINSFMTVLYTASVFSLSGDLPLPPLCSWLMQNWVASLLVAVTNILFLIYLFVKEYYYRRNFISLSAVKEGFDNLPTGLCFAKHNGMILLVNYKMIELCYEMFGVYIQNADEFWKEVCKGKTLDGIEKISDGEQPEYRLSDSTIWSFKKENVESVVQITASDVTDLYKLTTQLEEKNNELSAMNTRLKKYGETVDETTRSKERLETKMRIHNDLGQALLATRHSIKMKSKDYKPILDMWKRNIAVLRMEAEPQQNTQQLQSFLKAAEAAGIIIEISGNIPYEENVEKLFIASATESLTNAVRHAKAKKLMIESILTDDGYTVLFTNDGEKPDGVIREGGGLSSLRRKIERSGGEMKISSKPEFLLQIKLKKEVNLFD